jgi:hypothetical protein
MPKEIREINEMCYNSTSDAHFLYEFFWKEVSTDDRLLRYAVKFRHSGDLKKTALSTATGRKDRLEKNSFEIHPPSDNFNKKNKVSLNVDHVPKLT